VTKKKQKTESDREKGSGGKWGETAGGMTQKNTMGGEKGGWPFKPGRKWRALQTNGGVSENPEKDEPVDWEGKKGRPKTDGNAGGKRLKTPAKRSPKDQPGWPQRTVVTGKTNVVRKKGG